MSRTPPPAWTVDPASPAVPAFDPDAEDDERRALEALQARAPQRDLVDEQRQQLERQVADLHLQGTRLHLQVHAARRALRHVQPAPGAGQQHHQHAASVNKGGRPGDHARNDRLLALYEQTPAHLPRLQRCRIAAQRLREAQAAEAGQPVERVRLLPATTARDAIGEAMRRRAHSK